jgi:hypothetical protein
MTPKKTHGPKGTFRDRNEKNEWSGDSAKKIGGPAPDYPAPTQGSGTGPDRPGWMGDERLRDVFRAETISLTQGTFDCPSPFYAAHDRSFKAKGKAS